MPQFIEECYFKRFKVERPIEVLPLEEVVSRHNAKKERKSEDKQIKINNPQMESGAPLT